MACLLQYVNGLRAGLQNIQIKGANYVDEWTCNLKIGVPEPPDLSSANSLWTPDITDLTAEWIEESQTLSLRTFVPLIRQPQGKETERWIKRELADCARSMCAISAAKLTDVDTMLGVYCWLEVSPNDKSGGLAAMLKRLLEGVMPFFCVEVQEYVRSANAPFTNYVSWTSSRA